MALSTTSDSPARTALDPVVVEQMRTLVEGTDRSYRSIAEELGLSQSTISRLAAAHRWQRPSGAPRATRAKVDRRDKVIARAWRLAERHTAALEALPVGTDGQALTAVTALTRVLTNLERLMRTAPPPAPAMAPELPEGRSLDELHDELAAALDRIMAEERAAMQPDFKELLRRFGTDEDRASLE